MVEISEIKDTSSLEAWLQDKPSEFATVIAARSALRTLPLFWDWSLSNEARKTGFTALPLLQCIFTAAVACRYPRVSLKDIDVDVSKILHTDGKGISSAAWDAGYAVDSAVRLQAGHAANAAYDAVSGVFFSKFFSGEPGSGSTEARSLAAATIWGNVHSDCSVLQRGIDLLSSQLWHDENPFAGDWQDLRPKVLSAENWQPGDWQFWVEWYDQMLDPIANPPKWELLEQVALIEPKVWEAGPEAVSEAIAAIQLGFAERALATGERFEYDEGRDLFVRNPVPAEDKATLKYCVARLAELSELAETMGNMQGILGGELFFIRRAVENHADNPVMVWDNCGNAMRMLQSNLASGTCPAEEPYVTILQATLVDVRIKLERDPAVQHVAPHRPETAPIDDAQVVEVVTDALDVIAEVVEPDVAEEITQDRATLLDRFAGAGRRTAAFITGAARIVGIVVAAIPGALLGVMDYGVAFSERLVKLTENSGKIFKNIWAIVIGGTVGTGAVATATNPEKIPQALEMIVKIFGG